MAAVTADLLFIAEAAGLEIKRRRAGPCPACHEARTKTDARPPVLLGRSGWRCVNCGMTGDGITLASLHLGLGPQPRGKAFRDTLNWIANGEPCKPRPKEQDELKSGAISFEVIAALAAAQRLSRAKSPELSAWLAQRCISSNSPAGWLPNFQAEWWPRGWSHQYPVVLPACSGRGVILSMHGLAIAPVRKRKSTWPKGIEARELLFAGPKLRAWMRGEAPPPSRLIITEGGPDYLSMADEYPTIGITSGSSAALRLLSLPEDLRVYVAAHPDTAGRHYAQAIADALAPHPVRLIPLHRLLE